MRDAAKRAGLAADVSNGFFSRAKKSCFALTAEREFAERIRIYLLRPSISFPTKIKSLEAWIINWPHSGQYNGRIRSPWPRFSRCSR